MQVLPKKKMKKNQRKKIKISRKGSPGCALSNTNPRQCAISSRTTAGKTAETAEKTAVLTVSAVFRLFHRHFTGNPLCTSFFRLFSSCRAFSTSLAGCRDRKQRYPCAEYGDLPLYPKFREEPTQLLLNHAFA